MKNKESIGWHVVLRPEDGRPLLTSRADRQVYARTMGGFVSRYSIFAFHAVTGHGHAGLGGSRVEAGQFVKEVKNALPHALGRKIPFLAIEPRAIEDARHLLNDLHYILGQTERHGEPDPLHDGSNLPDLLAFRVVAVESRAVIRRLLPSFRSRDLFRHLGGLELIEGSELRFLSDAAAAAIGLPRLDGNSPRVVRARVAAVRVGLSLGATSRQVGELLEITSRGVLKCASRDADPGLTRATLLQIGLREQVGSRSLGAEGGRRGEARA